MDEHRPNAYTHLLLKLLLAFATLLAMQAAFYLANLRIFHIRDAAEWAGIVGGNVVFGLATIATLYFPYTLLRLIPDPVRWKKGYAAVCETLYILATLLMIIPRGCNAAYYQYTYRLLSSEIFSYLGISGQMGSLAPHFAVDYWYAWAVPLGVFLVFLFFNSRIRRPQPRPAIDSGAIGALWLLVGLGVSALLIGGGLGMQHRRVDAARYCQPKNTALVSNDALNIVLTLGKPDLKEVQYLPADEAARLFPARHTVTTTADSTDTAHRRNIVLIVVESLGQEFMGCYNTQAGADTRTPFLDSLARHCTLYDGRANGKKSIEGITTLNSSVPNLMDVPLTNSQFRTTRLPSLARLLKRYGYHCAFFHGSYNGVMNFDSTCLSNGFDEYVAKNEYEAEGMGSAADYDGVWGILDEPFLQYTVRCINTYEEPFLAEVFTVSSHHPYPMPAQYADRFVEGQHPILKCIEYTDFALRRFFAEARQQPWFSNTLFIITADHSGHGLTREYNDYDGWYRIPMMVYDPRHPVGHQSARIVQQTDLLPSIADYLKLTGESFASFGSSLLESPDLGWQVYYGNSYYCMVSNRPESPKQHDITLLMGSHAIGSPEHVAFLKAVVQQYNYMIINDKLASK